MSPRISISLLSAQSDQRLLALVRDGHERAFEALVQRYRRPLLRYCRRMRLADGRAEDVVQQAFLQAWMALGRGVEVRELRPWLYRITHNAAVNAMRAGEPHGELTEAVQREAALAHESQLERTIAVREALGEVAELPRMQRQAIFLTAVDGQTHDEVASTLGISQGALRGLLYRARATLRSAAAALVPPPLLEWATGNAATAPTAERLAELGTGGGAAGLAGVLLKGAVVAVTAGALVTGTSVVTSHERRSAVSHGGAVGALGAGQSLGLSAATGAALGSVRWSSETAGEERAAGRRADGDSRRSGDGRSRLRPERGEERSSGGRSSGVEDTNGGGPGSGAGRGDDSGGRGLDTADDSRGGTPSAASTPGGTERDAGSSGAPGASVSSGGREGGGSAATGSQGETGGSSGGGGGGTGASTPPAVSEATAGPPDASASADGSGGSQEGGPPGSHGGGGPGPDD